MKAATQRPRIARSWQVVRSSSDAAGGKWALIKGDPVKSKAVRLGRQLFEPHFPALSDVLESVEPDNAPRDNGFVSQPEGGDELIFSSDPVAQTLVHAEYGTCINPAEEGRDPMVSPNAELSPLNGPRRAERQEVERCSKRQCLDPSSFENGETSMSELASGVKGLAATPGWRSGARLLLSEGNGPLHGADKLSGLLLCKEAVSMLFPAPMEHVAAASKTVAGARTSVGDGDESQAFQVCHNRRQVDAIPLSSYRVGDNAINGVASKGIWDVGANFPTADLRPSLFTSGAGRKLTISDEAFRKALAVLERQTGTEVVQCKETAVPCEHRLEPKVSDLALRKAVNFLEGSARAAPSNFVEDAAISSSEGVNTGQSGANCPTADVGASFFTSGPGRKLTISNAAFKKDADILERGTCAKGLQIEENLFPCKESFKPELPDLALENEVDVLEDSASACPDDHVSDPAVFGLHGATSWDVRVNSSGADMRASLLTSGAGRKLTVSNAAFRKAEAILERGTCAEFVQSNENAIPCADSSSKQKVSFSAPRKAVDHLECSPKTPPGDHVGAISGAAAAISWNACNDLPAEDVEPASLTLRTGHEEPISQADIRRPGEFLDEETCAESKDASILCQYSWKSEVSEVGVRKALELLESTRNATTPPTTCPPINTTSGGSGNTGDGPPTRQETFMANSVPTLSTGPCQGPMQKTVRSTGNRTLCAVQEQSKFPIVNQGCPLATPFKPPRLRRQLGYQQGEGGCIAENLAKLVKGEGNNTVNMSPVPKVSCPANEPQQVITKYDALSGRPVKKLGIKMRYCGHQPGVYSTVKHVDKGIIAISAENATSFKVKSSPGDLGAEDFRNMLLRAGVNFGYVTSQWVSNHYKWVIWKLASFERSFHQQAAGKYLNVQRVFTELLHRYRREYQNGHRSAIKRITERDSASSQMMVLCVSSTKAAFFDSEVPDEGSYEAENLNAKSSGSSTIELTDGWYRINAVLDQSLTELLQNGKMFVGQKLRICGAAFHGCTDGMPPLEAFSMSMLALHINGTFRAHRADTLGFCRALPIPLSLKCVKINGGLVAATIVAVNRLYPVLFRERLRDGRSVVRCVRAEDRAEAFYTSRRAFVMDELEVTQEGYVLPGTNEALDDGGQLVAQIVASADPEFSFAKMSKAQQESIAEFQSKRQVATQIAALNRAREVLEHADLLRRDVHSFLQIRVSEVRSQNSDSGDQGNEYKEGLLTTWDPTEDQIMSITEGALYRISDLIASDRSFTPSDKGLVQLRTTKSSKWQELSNDAAEKLQFAFTPRFASRISTLEEIPDGGEFDIACTVLHVGEVKQTGFRMLQWIFVADGSYEIDETTVPTQLLAIQHYASIDAFVPFESTMKGCVVGYCNLRKSRWDAQNDAWTSDAPQTSEYSSKLTTARFKHLKGAAEVVRKWAAENPSEVESLRDKVINEMIK